MTPTSAVVLAGGFGTRLQSVVSELPKPMAPINRKPFLYYLLKYLSEQGIKRVVLSVGYKHESIVNFFGDRYFEMDIFYAIENEPLGTGGAIKLAASQIKEDHFFVINGDTYFDISLAELYHSDSSCTLAAKKMTNFDRYGSMNLNENNEIVSFNEKKYCEEGWINGGTYCLSSSLFAGISKEKFSFETEILEPLSQSGGLKAVLFHDYFMDIGIPEDYYQFEEDIYTPFEDLDINKEWTLFLDRDGVINERLIDDYVKQLNELRIIEGVTEAITQFTKIFQRIVVVTNQQGIGRGRMTEEDLNIIHGFMQNLFESNEGKIEKFYFAPQLARENHPDRKPGIGMGLQAKRDFPEIDFTKSLMIGDSESDIEFGMKLGMKTIMLTNDSNILSKADYIFKNLKAVSQKIKTQ